MSTNPTKSGVGKSFPSPLSDVERGANRAEPNLLGRKDLAHERWVVEDCRAVRGEPRTDIANRVMFAPS